jgi:hypothetical protein
MRMLVFCACAVSLAAGAQQGTTGTGGTAQQGTTGTGGSTQQPAAGSATGEQRPSQDGAPPQAPPGAMMQHAPKPDPLLTAAFKNSVGSWRCTGVMTMPKEMGGGEVASRSQMTIRRELNGFLYEGEWRVEKSQAFPEMRGKMDWSYDPTAKKLQEISFDNAGNVMRGESDGEKDGKVVWVQEGTMMGQPSKMRTTVAMQGAQKIELTFEAQGDGGSWMPMGRDSCTKAGAASASK